jgi:hypothetical protein
MEEELTRRKSLSQAFITSYTRPIIYVPYSPKHIAYEMSHTPRDTESMRYIGSVKTYHDVGKETRLVFLKEPPFRANSAEILAQIPAKYFDEKQVLFYTLTADDEKKETKFGSEYFVGTVYLYHCVNDKHKKMYDPEYKGGDDIETFIKFWNLDQKIYTQSQGWYDYLWSFIW